MTRCLVLPLLALVASCAADDAYLPSNDPRAQTRLAKLLDGRTVGATRACITHRDAEQQEIVDERTIIFGGGRRTSYRSDIDACPMLDRNATIIRRSTSSSICRGEIFQVRSSSGIATTSCTFGPFTAYRSANR